MIIIDSCQNLGLSHLGTDQPGYAYCFSHLSIHWFEIWKKSGDITAHSTYLYNESKGSKDGNIVVNLLTDYTESNFSHKDHRYQCKSRK